MELLPDKEQLKQKAVPYLIAICTVSCLFLFTPKSETHIIEQTKFVLKVEEKEVIKYVTQKEDTSTHDNLRVEITRPDGTHIITERNTGGRHITENNTKEISKETASVLEQEKKREEVITNVKRYHLGLSVNVNRDIYISAGVRLGGLPVFLSVYGVPTSLFTTTGIGITVEF